MDSKVIDKTSVVHEETVTRLRRKVDQIEIKYEESVTETRKGLEQLSISKDTKKNWMYIIEKVREMRKQRNAPVDSLGALNNPDSNAPQETRNFQLLIALMLSAQTSDAVTSRAMENLKKVGLTIDDIYKINEVEIFKQIKNVNFARNKAKNIKKMAVMLKEDMNKRIPQTLEGITRFPGVGIKTGTLYLNEVLCQNVGIGVDTHVHRVANRLGWVKTEKPEDTKVVLEKLIPKEFWREINVLFVGFGQQICQPIVPQCQICLLNEICPEGINNTKGIKHELKKSKIFDMMTKKTEKSQETITIPMIVKTHQNPKQENMGTILLKDQDKENLDSNSKVKKVIISTKSLEI